MDKFEVVVSNSEHLGYIPEIHTHILEEATKKNMCEQEKEYLEKQIISGDALLVFHGEEWVGYAHLEKWESYIEICSSVVNPKFRNQGVGTMIKKACLNLASKKYPDKDIISLSHKISYRISRKLGFIEIDKGELDDELWKLCKQCREFTSFPDCRCKAMIYPK